MFNIYYSYQKCIYLVSIKYIISKHQYSHLQALSVIFLLFPMHQCTVVYYRNAFFYSLQTVFAQNFSASNFFHYFAADFQYYIPYVIIYANHCIVCTIFHFRQSVSFVACVLRHIRDASLNQLRLKCFNYTKCVKQVTSYKLFK